MSKVFISYSHKDKEWKNRLKPHLKMLEQAGKLTIWDDRSIDGGDTWYPEIKKAMEEATIAVCLISADFLSSDFCIKEEIPYLLDRRKKEGMLVIPILIRDCAWKAIDWLKTIQMIPHDGKTVALDFNPNWDTPFTEVAELILKNLKKHETLVKAVAPPHWSPPEKVDIDRLPVTGAELFGRQKELEVLDNAWKDDNTNVISLVAWGGVGKSTLVNKWREKMAADNYRGAQQVFAWSFYSQGTGEKVISADLFISFALKWFGDPNSKQGSPWDKAQRLAELIKKEKTLLILDGIESLQSYFGLERGKITDPSLAMLITELALENPGLCVITTRENISNLADYSNTSKQIDLEQISPEAGRALLRVSGVQGTDAELEQAAKDFGLHALALNLLAAYIHEIPGHHISHASSIPDINVAEQDGKHPRRVIEAFAKQFRASSKLSLLQILGLFSSPVEKKAISSVYRPPAISNLSKYLQGLKPSDWNQLYKDLRRLKLVAHENFHRSDIVDTHPLIREHFGQQLKQEFPDAWSEGNKRLYEYYKSSAKDYPDTIEEMSPLYAAVMHGCQAGLHQETLNDVYKKRILRGNEHFSLKKLGAFGSDLSAISGFFNPPWTTPVATLSEEEKGFLLGQAGFYLRALGRLEEATQPMKAGLDIRIVQENWKSAAINANNLSELYLTIGNVPQAITYAEQSLEFADRSSNMFQQMIDRTTLAYALYQAGQVSEAESLFQEAEMMQKKIQSEYPLLYSLGGYKYCDLLLSMGKYQDVKDRAKQTIVIHEQNNWLLDIALDNLSLGRAHLFQSQQDPKHPFTESIAYLSLAVEGLRKAGTLHHLPFGLLARAEFYRVTKDFNKAQKDLDEVFSITKRCGMGLHLTDCHLGYARLWIARLTSPHPLPGEGLLEDPKQNAREHLDVAKQMIEKTGYHRRDKDVKEIEELLRGIE